jgi:hypothetical protein
VTNLKSGNVYGHVKYADFLHIDSMLVDCTNSKSVRALGTLGKGHLKKVQEDFKEGNNIFWRLSSPQNDTPKKEISSVFSKLH